jgi:hypothetical protein
VGVEVLWDPVSGWEGSKSCSTSMLWSVRRVGAILAGGGAGGGFRDAEVRVLYGVA